MLSPGASLLVAVCLGLIAGIGYPYLDIALACREAASEACVWGKAYFSLTLTVSIVLIGGERRPLSMQGSRTGAGPGGGTKLANAGALGIRSESATVAWSDGHAGCRDRLFCRTPGD